MSTTPWRRLLASSLATLALATGATVMTSGAASASSTTKGCPAGYSCVYNTETPSKVGPATQVGAWKDSTTGFQPMVHRTVWSVFNNTGSRWVQYRATTPDGHTWTGCAAPGVTYYSNHSNYVLNGLRILATGTRC